MLLQRAVSPRKCSAIIAGMRVGDLIRQQLVRARGNRGAMALAIFIAALSVGIARFNAASPRAWSAGEVPVAFWAWRSRPPRQDDVERAIAQTGARTFFVRAGQIDVDDGHLRCVRATAGRLPAGVEAHLVYNATPALLAAFEKIETAALADQVAASYNDEARRAAADAAQVAGVQLDFDVPTRLLARYATLLNLLRQQLPAGARLSITGLPTWMTSADLGSVLATVDFWIPQLYGAQIPSHLDEMTAITSAQAVARDVRRAASFNRPFYAGLAAYGYAIHCASNGARLAVIGDLDPALIADRRELQLIERRPFESSHRGEMPASEWRYVYRATEDTQLDHLLIRAGEWLMLDVPTAEALAACARAVREQAGEHLLGVCVFRLPEQGDATALSLAEIAGALRDEKANHSFVVEATTQDVAGAPAITLNLTNDGVTRARLGEGAASFEVRLPAGSLRQVSLRGFATASLLCDAGAGARNCSLRRANTVRLELNSWSPGDRAGAVLMLASLPSAIEVRCTISADDGREISERRTIPIKRERTR
jgi:Protein of unknown function (DUF3142)